MKKTPASDSNEMFDVTARFPFDESWKFCKGRGVSIAIIDSGVDT